MSVLFRKNTFSGNGKRLTGFPRYTEVIEQNFRKFLLTNLMTLAGFLPLIAAILFSVLSSSILVLIPSCICCGLLAGPALSCMYDAIFRGLRDAPGKWWQNYRHAWKQNWRQSLLPGVIFCLMIGIYIFMFMLFWWADRFPGWGTLAVCLFSLLLFTAFFTIYWPQVALFDQSFRQRVRNCLLFILRYPGKMLCAALLQLLYWGILGLFLPWSVALIPLTGFWFILYTTNFLLYNTINESFQIENLIAEAFPDQVPFYEDDETWLKRKQEEAHEIN